MDNIRDWCISASCGGGTASRRTARLLARDVARETPAPAPSAAARLEQDEDVLDTWFSSGCGRSRRWGGPRTRRFALLLPDQRAGPPGYDILFFWVARMIMLGLHFSVSVPFRGRATSTAWSVTARGAEKMSKSLGNGIDPLDVVEKYGAEALSRLKSGN
jgi:valyl-tRNA synthetase